jgi:hypothetical protein
VPRASPSPRHRSAYHSGRPFSRDLAPREAFVPTLREDPADAEVISHKLLLRAGIVRQLSSGIYSYLPLGQRIASKVMQILREEMNLIGGQEFQSNGGQVRERLNRAVSKTVMRDFTLKTDSGRQPFANSVSTLSPRELSFSGVLALSDHGWTGTPTNGR